MNKKEKIRTFGASFIISALIILGLTFLLTELELYLRVILYIASVALSVALVVLEKTGHEKLAKSIFVGNCVFGIVMLAFFVMNLMGLFESLSDLEHIKTLILSTGTWGVAICFLLVLFNVIVLPAPSVVLYMAISQIYGAWTSFLIAYSGTIVGSIVAFYIGRKFGKPAVEWIVGKEDTEKYSEILSKRGKMPFLIMQLLPFFPDDILCMVAGLSTMTFKFFFLSILIVRPLYIASCCFLGEGKLIPFSGWGIPVWILIFAVVIGGCLLYFKHQEKVDDYLSKKFMKNETF